jgi:ABC-2 type transport system permease protein
VANLLFDDRKGGVLLRVQGSGVHAIVYVVGLSAAGFVAVLSMMLVFFGYLLFSGQGAALPLLPAFVLCLLFGLFVVAFALVCGLLAPSRQAMLWIVVATSTIFSLMGGAFFPVEYAPQFMQQLAHIVPTYWFSDALSILVHEGTGTWLVSAGVLALYIVLCVLVAGVCFATRSAER